MATEVSNIIKADVNFTVLKGDTFDAAVTFYDAFDRPLNFTGATVIMHIRDVSDVLLVTLVTGSGFTIANNMLTFNYIPTLTPDLYYYDLQCTFASGVKKTLIGGKFKVLKEITTA